jgi:peptide subunit release factor RF-3
MPLPSGSTKKCIFKTCASKLKKKIQKLQMELNHRKIKYMKIFSGKFHKNLTRKNGVYEV